MDQAHNLRDLIQSRPDLFTQNNPEFSSRVITITSGKGGVGKTNFAVNLALMLQKQGKRVVIIDADFGLANIEVLLGVTPRHNLSDVLSGNKDIEDVLTPGPLDLQFISGGSGLTEMANLSEQQMRFLIENLIYLDSIADVILIDTGAGISRSVVNFIVSSQESIVVTTPEPTSITDAYAIIKTVNEEKVALPKFKIVVNKVDHAKEGNEIFRNLNKVSEQFLGIHLEYLGAIPYDRQLVKAVKKQEPVSISYPNCTASKSIDDIGLRLLHLNPEEQQEGLLTFVRKLTNIFKN